MKTVTVKLEDELAEALERLYPQEGFASKSELVREALRQWLIARRKRELEANLARYLQEGEALREAADEVERRLAVTEEALARVEEREV
jgi:Arc/MetJ-type ribon-helix-helix transcriptional regulator